MIAERRCLRGRIEEILRLFFLWLAVPISLLIVLWWIDPRRPLTERLVSPGAMTIPAGGSFTVQRELCANGLVNEHRQLHGEAKVILLPSYTVDSAGHCRMTNAVVTIPADTLPGMYEYQVLGEVGLSYNPLITYVRPFTAVHVHVEPATAPTGSNAEFIRQLSGEMVALRRRVTRLSEQLEFLEARARRLMLERDRAP